MTKMSRALLCGHILQIKNSGFLNVLFKDIKYTQHCFKWQNVCGKISCKQFSVQKSQKSNNLINKYVAFTDFLNFRKEEAKRSIIVQVQSAHSFKELHAYCNQMGCVNRMFHYTSGVEPLHFILVEFASENDAKNVLCASCHIEDNQAVPVKSPFLWFRVANSKKSSQKLSKLVKLDVENGNKLPVNDAIRELIKCCESISDQMRVLHETTKLNDLGIRLRFLTARQIELAITGMFPDAVAYPFGSSINGCGKLGCDLDLILRLDQSTGTKNSRLIYQCKAGMGNERSQSQRHMEAIGDLLHLFLPGCSQVRRILQARVPILKYNQQFTDIECDLSMTNMTALHMSELLYLFGSIDDRVRPLVFTIRKWALEVGLTNSSPGRWISNFSLTLLVLAFLQRTPTSVPVLPSINTLMKLEDKEIIMSEVNEIGAFLQDINKLQQSKKNSETLETLLHQFFEYYSNFDFSTKAISLNEAAAIAKPEHCALYIVNPLERGLNVSKNVSLEELERLRIEFRNAAWTLESQESKIGQWGILALFANTNKSKGFFAQPSRQNRMMEVKKLFDEETLKSDAESEETKIEFKNDQVKTEVDRIKKDTRSKIHEIATSGNKVKDNRKRRSARRR